MRKVVVFVVGALFVLAGIASLEFNSPTESAFEEGILFLASDTEYASGFSHEAFHQIKVGDAEARVYELLGQPLQANLDEDGSTTMLIYSASTDGSIHRRRDILISDDAVKKVFAEMWWD